MSNFNHSLLLLIFTSFMFSCGNDTKKSEVKFFQVNSKVFSKYINPKKIPKNPNLSLDKTIFNNEYPIEIAIYEENEWYYNLPNLGEGKGSWKFEGGVIKLFAERILFDMHIDVLAKDEKAEQVEIRFSDRFGRKVLDMENQNIR